MITDKELERVAEIIFDVMGAAPIAICAPVLSCLEIIKAVCESLARTACKQ